MTSPSSPSTFSPHRTPHPPHRLHLHDGPPYTFAWPPTDPPTGTPKNGKRLRRRQRVATVIEETSSGQQLLSPPATQEQQASDSSGESSGWQREATPDSPTPTSVVEGTGSDHAALPFLPTPATLMKVRPVYSVDREEEAPLLPSSPGPADAIEAESNREVLLHTTADTMALHQAEHLDAALTREPSSSPIPFPPSRMPSQAATTHVSETPQANNPINHQSGEEEEEEQDSTTEVHHLRHQRSLLTDQLRSTTACTHWLRTRNTIEQSHTLAARALEHQARQDRDAAQRDLAGVRREVSWVKRLLVLVLVGLLMYVGWYHWWMGEEMRYVRKRRAEGFGL